MHIRDYHPADLPWLYHICLKTGLSGQDATTQFSDPYLLGAVWAAPYAQYNSRAVLILEEAGQPLGYILGTPDTAAYSVWVEAAWLPLLQQRYPVPEAAELNKASSASGLSPRELALRQLLFSQRDQDSWQVDYPGHLHIDILPAGQGGGWGRKLMDAYMQRLHELGCPAVQLGVARENSGGVRFYERYGMSRLHEDAWTIYFGCQTRRPVSESDLRVSGA
ncbi:MAG: GNAT family N-acetyltransferase [Spirochaetes bacterium]|nr:GNAT family N-acetyltransferase [Spirochaetota bacterium]MBU0956645.1 GNAT family N-acetyltransferase [Spirochaetota bacterium]